MLSSPPINVRPEEIEAHEKRADFTACVIGCDEVGLYHSILFAEAGFHAICADLNPTATACVSKGKTPFLTNDLESALRRHLKSGQLTVSADINSAVSCSSIVVVAKLAEVDGKKSVDYSKIEKALKKVGSSLRQGSLVIIVRLVGIGTMESLEETLENASGLKTGTDFGLAYSPHLPIGSRELVRNADYVRVVAASDKESLSAASKIIEIITKDFVKKLESMKTAETAALLDLAWNQVGIALAYESALLCEKVGADFCEISSIQRSEPKDSPAFHVQLDSLSHEKLSLLLEDAENLNIRLRCAAAASEVARELPKHVVDLTRDALKSCGKTLRKAHVSVLGFSETANARGPAKGVVVEVLKSFEAKSVRVNLYDPYMSGDALAESCGEFKKTLTEAVEGSDCILIFAAHDQFKRLNLSKLKALMKKPAAIVDLECILDPGKIEKEGFVYRGLGRGVWTK